LLRPLVQQGRLLLPASAPDVADTHGHWLFPVVVLGGGGGGPSSPSVSSEEEGRGDGGGAASGRSSRRVMREEEAAVLARVVRAMRRAGFDVTRGATQLGCVAVSGERLMMAIPWYRGRMDGHDKQMLFLFFFFVFC
jgi:hypothetical protein